MPRALLEHVKKCPSQELRSNCKFETCNSKLEVSLCNSDLPASELWSQRVICQYATTGQTYSRVSIRIVQGYVSFHEALDKRSVLLTDAHRPDRVHSQSVHLHTKSLSATLNKLICGSMELSR